MNLESRIKVFLPLFIILNSLFFPQPVSAHAFGALYTLPLPFWLYSYGAAVALIISFLLIGAFAREGKEFNYPRISLSLNHWIVFLFQILVLAFFVVSILAGFLGIQSPVQNFAPNFFWIIFLLGFTYLSGIFGNFWERLNPWKLILSPFNLKPTLKYPQILGYTPALVFYFILIWLEILSEGLGARPQFLSILLLTYSFINILGSILFGKDVWFKYGEFFSVFFGIISKLSPLRLRSGSTTFSKEDVLNTKADHPTLLLFILFALSSTAFDGFRSTTPFFRYFFLFNQTLLLSLAPILFLILYSLAILLMKLIVKTYFSFKSLSLHFAFSLIPIALAYNIAHYFPLLLIQGQAIITLISDPLSQGWNLLGTSDYQINVGLIGANFVWNFQVLSIIGGHILAVFIAHLLALKLFPNRKQALLSQIPMLLLMIFYTIAGLWILSQPIMAGEL